MEKGLEMRRSSPTLRAHLGDRALDAAVGAAAVRRARATSPGRTLPRDALSRRGEVATQGAGTALLSSGTARAAQGLAAHYCESAANYR